MEQTKLGNDDWAKIPAQNKYATPVKSKAYQYSPYDKTFQDITDNFVGSDKFRPVFSGVFFNELGICTTDSHKLLYINHISDKYSGDYCVTPKCKKIVGEYSIKDDKIDGKFPQYQNIIPNESIFVYDIDLLSLKTYCEIVIRSGFVNATTNRIALTFDDKKIFGINGKFLIEGIESFLIMGHKKVKVGLTTQNRAMLFVADNNYDGTESPIGKSDFFLIMPLMSDSKEKEFNYAFMQGDIDFDNLLNIAYSLEKDAVITKGGEVFHKIDTSITKSDVKDAGELNLEQLQIAASFIKASKNSTLPILNTVKIENNTLNISNLEQAYSISDVNMPNGIYEIRGTALFPTKYDIDDFPKMPSDFKKVGQINRQELIKNFEHCLDFVGDDDLRPVMEGVHFYKDAMNLVIESTDAHALYRNEIKNYNIDSEFNIIITKPKLVYKVLESFDCDEIDFYIQESGKNAYFECGTGKIYFFIESGRYPNTRAIYPESYFKKLIFEAKDFKKLESDIKRLAKKGGFKTDFVNAMFNFTDSGIANYTICHTPPKEEFVILETGAINCKVMDDYSILDNTFKTLIMPVGVPDKNFDLGFRIFNLNRLSSLGFDKVELGYNKPSAAVIVLNESVLAGVKTVPNQKKKEVKKKAVEPIVDNDKMNYLTANFFYGVVDSTIDGSNNTIYGINIYYKSDKGFLLGSALVYDTPEIALKSILKRIAKISLSTRTFETMGKWRVVYTDSSSETKDFNSKKEADEFIKDLSEFISYAKQSDSKTEIVIEDSAEVKEWKEAIENLNMLLEEGGTDAENTEWREAIDNLNYLIEETPKMDESENVSEIFISKPYYFKTDDFIKQEGYRIDNKFSDNYYAGFPISKGLMTKEEALKKANAFYDFVKNAKNEAQYEKLVQDFIHNWNTLNEIQTPKMAKGGGVDKVGDENNLVIYKIQKIVKSKDGKYLTESQYDEIKNLMLSNKSDILNYELEDIPNDLLEIIEDSELYYGFTENEIKRFLKNVNKLGYTFNYVDVATRDNSGFSHTFKPYALRKIKEYSKGGGVGNENALMVANNNKQIFHHTKEMAEALKGAKNVPAWVVAKVNRSASDLSDATHYLEGAEGMYAEGGEMKGKHYDMEKEIMESQFGKSI